MEKVKLSSEGPSADKVRLQKKLKNKLNAKKDKRSNKASSGASSADEVNEESLFTMLNQVNQMLKQNPEMIKKVSKCVNSIFENKSLMDSLVSEIQTNVQEDQTFDNKTDTESEEAVSNESTQ